MYNYIHVKNLPVDICERVTNMLLYTNEELNLKIYSLDSTRWKDFELLFGERGACGGCWCMSWRLKKSEFELGKGEPNKYSMKDIVYRGKPAGVLAYVNDIPIGWCAVAPREVYKRLESSRVLRGIDDKPVWSISCLFIAKVFRRKGVSTELIKGAIEYAKLNGANIVEAYPVVPYDNNVPDAFLWTGVPAAFEAVGFTEVKRRSKWKLMMRYYI
jgi:GNAT superfamily N-acetyltransferase